MGVDSGSQCLIDLLTFSLGGGKSHWVSPQKLRAVWFPPSHLERPGGQGGLDLSKKVSMCPQSQAGSQVTSQGPWTGKRGQGPAASYRRAQKKDSLYRILGDPLGCIISLHGSTYAMVKRTAGIGKSRAPWWPGGQHAQGTMHSHQNAARASFTGWRLYLQIPAPAGPSSTFLRWKCKNDSDWARVFI